ncbi:MAG: hypothetical protein ACTS77_04520 [Arsenophonus sp. NC-TX2-MAG3]
MNIFVWGEISGYFSLLFGGNFKFLSKQDLAWNQICLFVLAIIDLFHDIIL